MFLFQNFSISQMLFLPVNLEVSIVLRERELRIRARVDPTPHPYRSDVRQNETKSKRGNSKVLKNSVTNPIQLTVRSQQLTLEFISK